MIDIVKINMHYVMRQTIQLSGTLYSIVAIVLSFFSWDDIGIKKICNRAGILVGIMVLSFLISLVYVVFLKNNCVIWKRGNGKITLMYSDIIKKGFEKKVKNKRLVVIPVNTCFDTIVDDNIVLGEKPLVSPNTIHGKWLNAMNNIGATQNVINDKIRDYLVQRNINAQYELAREEKRRGNLLSYEKGTIVPIKNGENVTFLLLALSEFDDNNRGQCSKDELIKCCKKLIEYYNNNGQGFDIFLPLMGTNLSRVGLSHVESLHTIKSVMELYNDRIHGNMNIIVYSKDKDEVSIFE